MPHGNRKPKRRTRPPSKWRACQDKKQYTRSEAIGVAISMRKKQAALVTAYKCKYCFLPNKAHAWHVGHIQ